MTIFHPDLSGHQAGLELEPKTVAVVAKATEGTNFFDPQYLNFKAQAAKIGAEFCAYHWLWSGSWAEAKFVYSKVGKTPLSIDAENTSVKTTVAMILTFVRRYRKLGGVVHTVYLPHWYWQSLGSPDLRPLAKAGLVVNSSAYTTYSDDGVGWQPYGGVTPTIWQYTDRLPYAGQTVDFNAFKGTVQQLHNIWNYGTLTGPTTPSPKPVTGPTNVTIALVRLRAALKFHPASRAIRQAIRLLRGLK